MPIVSGGGGGSLPAGLSSGIVYQTGAGSPVDLVTPTQKGAVYQDKTNGALYLAIGATSADWLSYGGVAGNIGESLGEVFQGANRDLYILGGLRDTDAGQVYIGTAYAQWNGHTQGLTWLSGAAEGSESLQVKTGATGEFNGILQNGRGNSDLPGVAKQLGIRTAAIASGALPTVALVSGAGTQVSTGFQARDMQTVTPFTGDGTNNAATLAIALSPDNVTYSTLDTLSIAAAVNLTGVLTLAATVNVPATWYLRLTAVHGTIGTTTYY